MNPVNPLKKRLARLVPVFAAVAVLGTIGGYAAHRYMHEGCCHAGSSCCFPGSPCCAGHAAIAMK
jgi:hypothetical protein